MRTWFIGRVGGSALGWDDGGSEMTQFVRIGAANMQKIFHPWQSPKPHVLVRELRSKCCKISQLLLKTG